jgi:hypothetical protein
MDEQERDYLWQNIRQLERSKLRWKVATISLVAALAIFLIMGGFLIGARQLRQTRMMLEVERARGGGRAYASRKTAPAGREGLKGEGSGG